MKKITCGILMLCSVLFLDAFSQRYRDEFLLQNNTDNVIHMQFKISKRFEKQPNGYHLNMGNYVIPINNFAEDTHLDPKKIMCLWFNSYMYNIYHNISVWDKFKLIVATLTVTDEEGNVLLTLADITEEDFEIHIEDGITTATLVIRER